LTNYKKMNEETNLGLGEDLGNSIPATLIGICVGIVSAFVYPRFLEKTVKGLRKGYVKDVSSFLCEVSSLTTYSLVAGNYVVKPIIENPNEPMSYLGVGLNALSGAVQLAYHLGKGKKNNLETVASE
jgi:hypothetical protein